MIKISIVNYTNTLPFKWALKRSSIIQAIDLQEDIPSICAQKLKFKQVDLALVPVALLPELDTYFIETDFCIGANGKVDSVKLYSQVPLNEIKTITLDYQSKSSITLTKVLLKFFWKLQVAYLDAKPGFESEIKDSNAAVIIGDRTFSLNGKYKYEYDLAEEWKKFTGLPFVFAAWVSTEKLSREFIEEFNSVLKFGIENINKAIDEDYNDTTLSKEKTIEYLTKRIDYNLNSDKTKALNLFLNYIKQL
ncbi:MAG: menaquinone biosynthesis protein [Bacteroidota bacterium]|nr:menaquinone biosynthesis protein [Bacteroidota bacterium]MDP3144019.1 menaquinone biosynthesis protein [Bacteroidota bacterium]